MKTLILRPFSLQAFRFFLSVFCLQSFSLSSAAQTIFSATATGTYVLENETFSNAGAGAVATILVDGDGVRGSTVLSATNIAALATGNSGAAIRVLHLNAGAVATIHGGTLRQEAGGTPGAGREYAVYLQSNAKLTGEDLFIEATGPRIHAVVVGNNRDATLILARSTIQNTGSAAAIWVAGSGIVLLNSTTIRTSGAVAPGILAGAGSLSRITLEDGAILTTGQNSPAIWLGGNSQPYSSINLKNTLLSAADGAAIDINTALPGLQSRPSLASWESYWFCNYDIAIVSSTITGAAGALRATSSVDDGGIIYELRTQTRLWLTDSLAQGDVAVSGDAKLTLALERSTLDGALIGASASPAIILTATNSTLKRGIALSGSATLELDAAGTTITGTLSASGNATAKVLLTGSSTIDAVAFSGSSILELTMDNTSRILGDFTFTGGATYTLLPADNRALTFPNALTLASGGNLRVAPSTQLTLTAPLTLADSTATITLANARGDDLILAAGATGSGRLAVHGLHADALGQPELRVIATAPGAPRATFALAGLPASRLFAYHGLENRPDGAYLTDGGFSSAGAAILNTSALAATDLLDTFDMAQEASSPAVVPSSASATPGLFWLTTRAALFNVDGAAPGLAFTQHTYTLATGVDLRFNPFNNDSILVAGLYAVIALAEREFTGDADGRSTTHAIGARARYDHPSGWRLATNIRISQSQNTLGARDPGATLQAEYTARAVVMGIEAGRRFQRRDGWWFDPSLSIAQARLSGASYDTTSATADNRFRVTQSAASATRLRATLGIGRALDENWSLRARLAASYLDISGGKISCDDLDGADFQLDGSRLDVALALERRLGKSSRLVLEISAATTADYTAPWSVTLGFAKAW